MAQPTALRYVAKGFLNDSHVCEMCPKPSPIGTVRLAVVAPDGKEIGEVLAGVVCASYVSGRPVQEIRGEAEYADRLRARRILETHRAWRQRRADWFVSHRIRALGANASYAKIREYRASDAFKEAEAAYLQSDPEPPAPPTY